MKITHQRIYRKLALLAGCLALLGSWPGVGAAPLPSPTATVQGQLTNLHRGKGTCYLALFSSAEGFPKQTSRAVRTLRVPVTAASCSFSFERLPPGSYALSVYHDENDNGRLDTNFLGIPTERYGFSNNARKMMFFPPSFAAARFEVPAAGATLLLHLK